MKAALFALIVAAVAVAVWLARGPDPLGESAAQSASSEDGKSRRSLSPDAVLSIAPGGKPPRTAATAAKPQMSAALAEYLQAKALRPVYDRLAASTNRTAEETYILAAIVERCATITDRKRIGPPRNPEEERKRFLATLSDKDPDAARRIDAYDRASKSSCEGFDGVEATQADVRKLLEQVSADPKAQARLVEKDVYATMPKTEGPIFGPDGKSRLPLLTDAQLADLQRAAQSGDPVAIATVGRVLGSTMNDFVVRAGANDQAVDPRVWNDAWRLAACDSGANCGADSGWVLYPCAMQGNCGAQDYREYLFFFEHSPQQSQRLQEYETQLLQAMRTGDWSYFNFHRGPSQRNWMTIQIQP